MVPAAEATCNSKPFNLGVSLIEVTLYLKMRGYSMSRGERNGYLAVNEIRGYLCRREMWGRDEDMLGGVCSSY